MNGLEKLELQSLVQNNFNDIADLLDNIYNVFYKNESLSCFENIIKIIEDFNTILNEYIKIDNQLNVSLVVESIKSLISTTERRDVILLSDILRFEFQEYLQVMFDFLENN